MTKTFEEKMKEAAEDRAADNAMRDAYFSKRYADAVPMIKDCIARVQRQRIFGLLEARTIDRYRDWLRHAERVAAYQAQQAGR